MKLLLFLISFLFLQPAFGDEETYVGGVKHDTVELLEFHGLSGQGVSPANKARLYFSATEDTLRLSENTGAYSNIQTKASSDTLYLSINSTASDLPIADSGSIITATEVETALQENRTAIDLNTAKETNTDTQDLGIDGNNVTLVDGGTADVSTTTAVTANTNKTTNATHTGEVTGSGALALDPTCISGKADVTSTDLDYILIIDQSDSWALKKVDMAEVRGGGGAPATADISDVSVTQTELAELETIGATTISANQWTALGSIAETLTGTELSLLDGITVLSGSNTGDQTINTADIADVSVTQTELAELETIGATTISANQWATLGGIAETLGSAELNLLDGIITLSGANTGDNTVATTGDSATSFFSSGTIEKERLPDASPTADGVVELAVTAEIDTGTDSTRAIPVDQFVASKRNIRWLVFNLVEAATNCAAATNIAGDFVSPIAGTVLQSDTTPFYLYATNSTAGTTGTMVVDISFGGTSIMTTNKLDFDTTEKTTTTASTPPDLTDTTLAVGDIITIDIDAIHTTAAKGLTVYMAIRE